MSDFVWPSDSHRAENRELDRVCDYLEDTLDKLDALRATNSDLRALYESARVELGKARARVAELERDVAKLEEFLDTEAAGRAVDEGPKLIDEGQDLASAAPNLFKRLHDARQVDRVARAICTACDENPDHSGDCRGNDFRWQDYREAAIAAIRAVFDNEEHGHHNKTETITRSIAAAPQLTIKGERYEHES